MISVEKDKPSVLFDLENTMLNVSYGPKVKKKNKMVRQERGLGVRI